MQKNSSTANQLHLEPNNNSSQNLMQYEEKIVCLRKRICEVIVTPEKMGAEDWKKLQFSIAKVMGNDYTVQILVNYLKELHAQGTSRQAQADSRSKEEHQSLKNKIVGYLLVPMQMLNASRTQKLWRYRQYFFESEMLQKKLKSGQLAERCLDKPKLSQIILMNKIVCCFQLELYQKALEIIQASNEIYLPNDFEIVNWLEFVKKNILLKMGCRLIAQPTSRVTGNQKVTQSRLAHKLRIEKELCFKIIALDREALASFIQNLKNNPMQISPRNLYNLALVCKKNRQIQCSENILNKLIESQEKKGQNSLTSKCLVLLSEIEEEKGNLSMALELLNKMQLANEIDKNEWYFRKVKLQKKITIDKGAKTCPISNPKSTKRFNLLCGLQNQLKKLTDQKQNTQLLATKKNSYNLYQIVTRKKTVKKILALPEFVTKPSNREMKTTTKQTKCSSLKVSCQSLETTQLYTNQEILTQTRQEESKFKIQQEKIQIQAQQKQITPNEINSERQCGDYKDIQQKIIQPITNQANQQIVQKQKRKQKQQKQINIKKGVRFQVTQQDDQIVSQIIYQGEERITYLLMNEDYEKAVVEIKANLQKLQQQKFCHQTQKFIIKCVNWYQILGRQNQAVALLKVTINDTKQQSNRPQFKKHCLKLLGELYQGLKDSKNALNVYLQLANSGQVDYYDKLAQLQLVKQHYIEAVRYSEMYHQYKQNLYSKSKLAHSYSKMAIYKKKALDLLNEMLFQSKNLVIFKNFEVEEIPAAQNAVLLLVSIYLNYQSGCERARNVCQKFLQINFSAYPVYYMLGVIYEYQGNKEQAFKHYLTALKLKPNHLPSLMRIVNDIGVGNSHNFEITNILRKAFVQNSRDWELLQLLIQSITLKKHSSPRPTVQQLISYGKILQKAEITEGDMDLQIELVWTWAFQVMQQRRRKEQVVEDEHQNQINMKLGEINMTKGNFKASEFYLMKVLTKLQVRRRRTDRRRGVMKFELEAIQKLSYIKSKQNQTTQDKACKKEDYLKSFNQEIEKKLDHERKFYALSPRFTPF